MYFLKFFFKNTIGLGRSLKIFKSSQNVFSKSLNNNQNLNSILVDDCEIENQEKGNDAIYYIMWEIAFSKENWIRIHITSMVCW